MGEWKFVQMVLITWPRWLPCPYMVKTLKNFLLQNQKTDDLESWYAASGAWELWSLFKWWLWVDADLFYGKVEFGPLCFLYGKVKTMDFSETIVVYDIKVGRCSQLNEYMKLYEYQRSRSFIDPGPNLSNSVFLNFFSSVTADFNISLALRWAIQDQWSSCLFVIVSLFNIYFQQELWPSALAVHCILQWFLPQP